MLMKCAAAAATAVGGLLSAPVFVLLRQVFFLQLHSRGGLQGSSGGAELHTDPAAGPGHTGTSARALTLRLSPVPGI